MQEIYKYIQVCDNILIASPHYFSDEEVSKYEDFYPMSEEQVRNIITEWKDIIVQTMILIPDIAEKANRSLIMGVCLIVEIVCTFIEFT